MLKKVDFEEMELNLKIAKRKAEIANKRFDMETIIKNVMEMSRMEEAEYIRSIAQTQAEIEMINDAIFCYFNKEEMEAY